MTSNQVNWVNAMENKRSNLENERIKQDANAITQLHYARQDSETQRSNLENERLKGESNAITRGYYAATTAEQYRSNVAKEQETYRSNLAKELENYRSNVARETETQRSNLANEALETRGLNIKSYDARTSRQNAQTNAKNAETNRRNAATNAYNAEINARNASTNAFNANTSRMAAMESARANRMNEQLKSEQNDITRSYNAETIRINDYRATNEMLGTQSQIGLNNEIRSKYQSENALTQAKTVTESTVPALNKAKTTESESKSALNFINAADTLLKHIRDGFSLLVE